MANKGKKKEEDLKELTEDQGKVFKKILTGEMLKRISTKINDNDPNVMKSILEYMKTR